MCSIYMVLKFIFCLNHWAILSWNYHTIDVQRVSDVIGIENIFKRPLITVYQNCIAFLLNENIIVILNSYNHKYGIIDWSEEKREPNNTAVLLKSWIFKLSNYCHPVVIL
jgi:hypothetical protein